MYCEILPVMDHEFLYSQKGLLTYIRVIMCHHPHDPHFTPKILQYARNKRVHTSCMKSWLIFAASIRNLSGCEIKARKKTSGLNGIWTHDLFDTGAVQYCFTCPLVEHSLVTMNVTLQLFWIGRMSLRQLSVFPYALIYLRRQITSGFKDSAKVSLT